MSQIIDVNAKDLEHLIRRVGADIRKAFGTLIPGESFTVITHASGIINKDDGKITKIEHNIAFERYGDAETNL